MAEVGDKFDDGKAGAQSGAARPRAQWQRPIVWKLQAGEAELGVTHGGPDGTFTTS